MGFKPSDYDSRSMSGPSGNVANEVVVPNKSTLVEEDVGSVPAMSEYDKNSRASGMSSRRSVGVLPASLIA
jgi:hypothetical protein